MQNFFKKILSEKFIFTFTLLFIIASNSALYIYSRHHPIPRIQSRNKTSGFSPDKAHKFIYFFYYTGYFPLATLNPNPEYSKEGAWKEIKQNGHNLIMEYKHWSRLGENLRIIAYMPDAILNGSPRNPSIKLFNSLILVIALLSILFAFKNIGMPVLGSIIALTVNLTPFFIFETYGRNNIFALLGATFLIIIALNLKFIYQRKTALKISSKHIIIALISGIIIGFVSEIRGENSVVLFSVIIIYLLAKTKWAFRILLTIIVSAAFIYTKKGIEKYFDYKFQQTYELVKKYGGHPYNGKRIKGHRFWHPVYCGLADFDNKYGHKFKDQDAYNFAVPVLKKKYGLDLKYDGKKYYLDEYYDKDSLYYKKFDDYDEYEEVMKEEVIREIKNAPLWYLRILFLRMLRIFTVTLPFNYAGWLTLFLSILLWKRKEYEHLILILASLPLSATPFLIYSGDYYTYTSFFPVLGFSLTVYFIYVKFMQKFAFTNET
jgi:hypothetical protein